MKFIFAMNENMMKEVSQFEELIFPYSSIVKSLKSSKALQPSLLLKNFPNISSIMYWYKNSKAFHANILSMNI